MLFVFILGLIVGSFLNVVILRSGTGETITRGRSRCFVCGRTLHWFELVPLLSFALQRGRCRACHSRIAWQYPAVEFLTGLLFTLTFWQVGFAALPLLFYWIAFSLLVIIVVYDLRHHIIPDGPIYALIVLSFFRPLVTTGHFLDGPTILTGLGLAAFFAALWYGSGGRWLGFGDAKLALGVGWLLGWPGGLYAIIWAFWIGAALGLLLVALKSFKMKSELPFAPFIVLGVWLVFFFNFHVWFF